jgi:hypothetical protein
LHFRVPDSADVWTTRTGLAAQGRVFLLFARHKEGVEIEEQPLDGVPRHLNKPTVPPRFAYRLEDPRAFHLMRVGCHSGGRYAMVASPRGHALLPKINVVEMRWDTFAFAASRAFSERVSHQSGPSRSCPRAIDT